MCLVFLLLRVYKSCINIQRQKEGPCASVQHLIHLEERRLDYLVHTSNQDSQILLGAELLQRGGYFQGTNLVAPYKKVCIPVFEPLARY